MLTFKKASDISKLHPEDPVREIVLDLISRLITSFTEPGQDYNFEDYGFLLRVLPEDDPTRSIHEIYPDWYSLLEVPWEGVYRESNGISKYLIGIMIFNNEGGYVFIFDDTKDLDPRLRQKLEAHLDE